MKRIIYRILYCIGTVVFRLWHPVFRVSGREHILSDRNMLICANHSGLADPCWILLAMNLRDFPRIMAKASLMKIPLFSGLIRYLGVFGVRRGESDVTAFKTALKALKDGENLLLFPEGTRVRPGKTVTAKSGAAVLALRTDTPILPVYLERKRYPFSPMRCVFGESFFLPQEDRKAPTEIMRQHAAEIMRRVYALGETS